LYFARMASLDMVRGQVLCCTNCDNPKLSHYFNPPEGADLDAAFREHLEMLWTRWLPEETESQFCSTAIVAAGLLSYGDLRMAAYILQHLPNRVFRNGICLQVSRRAFVAILPVPKALRGWSQWIEGSPEAEAVRSWFARHQSDMTWQPSSGTFVVPESEGLDA